MRIYDVYTRTRTRTATTLRNSNYCVATSPVAAAPAITNIHLIDQAVCREITRKD